MVAGGVKIVGELLITNDAYSEGVRLLVTLTVPRVIIREVEHENQANYITEQERLLGCLCVRALRDGSF